MTHRIFVLVAVHAEDGLLGIHAAAPADFADEIWSLLHHEDSLCTALWGTGMAPALPDAAAGMWCICLVADEDGLAASDPNNSPAPDWRRPTAQELSRLVSGETPLHIQKWIAGEAWA